jgi:hypothetical protein
MFGGVIKCFYLYIMARRMKYIRLGLTVFSLVDEFVTETNKMPKEVTLYDFQKWLNEKTYYKKKK